MPFAVLHDAVAVFDRRLLAEDAPVGDNAIPMRTLAEDNARIGAQRRCNHGGGSLKGTTAGYA
jgi:hypothetical protein